MSGHEAGADDCFPIANGWEDRRCGKNSLLKETLGENKGPCLAPDKDRHNGRLSFPNLESDTLETRMHLAGVAPELVDTPSFLLHDLEGLHHPSNNGRRECRRENKAPGLVFEILH